MLHTCTISAIGCKRARWLGPRPHAAGSQAASIIHRAPSIIHRAAFSSILPYEIVRTCRGLRGCGSIPTSSESVHLAALSQIRSRLGQHPVDDTRLPEGLRVLRKGTARRLCVRARRNVLLFSPNLMKEIIRGNQRQSEAIRGNQRQCTPLQS